MTDNARPAEKPEAKKDVAPPKAAARLERPQVKPQWMMKPPSEAPRPANRFEGPPQPAPYVVTPDTRHIDAYWRSRRQAMGAGHDEPAQTAQRRLTNPAFETRYQNDEYDDFDDIYQDEAPQAPQARRDKRTALARHGRTGRDLAIAAGLALSLSSVTGAAVYDRASGGTIAAAIMAPFDGGAESQALAEVPKVIVNTEEAAPTVAAVSETPPAPLPLPAAPETSAAADPATEMKPIATAKLEVSDATGAANTPLDLDLKAVPGQAGQDLELRLSGVPEDAYLTAGTKISPASWSLKPAEAAIVKLVLPAKQTGEFDLAVAAVETKTGELVAPIQEINVRIDSPTPSEEPAEVPAPVAEKAAAQIAEEPAAEAPLPVVEKIANEPDERAVVPPPQVTAALNPPAEVAGESKAVPVESLPEATATIVPDMPAQPAPQAADNEQARTLISRGDHLMSLGDLAAAREFYMEALKLGAAPTTLLQIGMTYDPVIYAANKVAGLSPDAPMALEYYRQADRAGVAAARDAIARLDAWSQKTSTSN